jgi:hypothetical protein
MTCSFSSGGAYQRMYRQRMESLFFQKSYAYAQAGKLACLIRKPYTTLQLQMDRRFGPLWHDHAQPRVAHLKLRLSRETSGTQAWLTLVAMAEAYSEIVGSGDCRRWTMTGSSSEDRRKFLQMAWSHILRRAKSTILSGDSVRASRLLGLRATVE